MGLLTTGAILAGTFVIQRLLGDSAAETREREDRLSRLDRPRVVRGEPIPLIIGSVRIRSPNAIWIGDQEVLEAVGQPAPIYAATVQYALGVPLGGRAEMKSIWVNEYRIFGSGVPAAAQAGGTGVQFLATNPNDAPDVAIRVSFPDAFGGPGRGGGVGGIIGFYEGTFDQQPDFGLRMSYAVDDGGTDGTFSVNFVSGNTAVIISPDKSIPVITDGTIFRLSGASNASNNGTWIATGDSSSRNLAARKLKGAAPVNESDFSGNIAFMQGDYDLVPGMPGVSHIVFRRSLAFVGGPLESRDLEVPEVTGSVFAWGESGSLPDISVEASAIPNALGFGAVGDDANPAEVLYALLTEQWAGLGLPTSAVDTVSFSAAAQALETEGMGISLYLTERSKMGEFILDILSQIEGVLYQEPTDGKFRLKLLRDDYDPQTIPVFNASNIVELDNYAVSSWRGGIDEVRVNYTDRGQGYIKQTVFAQDGAAIANGDGSIKSKTISHLGVTTPALADKVAARELRTLNLPLAKARFLVNRDAADLRPGDPFVFQWDSLSIVMRAQTIDLGTLADGRIMVECLQDLFAFGQTIFRQPDDVPAPTPTPPSIEFLDVFEMPLWLSRRVNAGSVALLPHLTHLASKPGSSVRQYLAENSEDGGATYTGDTLQCNFVGTATLETAYGYDTEPYDTVKRIRLQNLTDVTALRTALESDIRAFGANLVMIVSEDRTIEEIVAFETFDDLGSGVYRLNGVWRGLLDTVPQDHAVGARLWFFEIFDLDQSTLVPIDYSRLGQGLFPSGSVCTRMLARGNTALSSATDARIVQRSVTGRSGRPHPANDLLLDGVRLFGDVTESQGTLTWRRRQFDQGEIYRGDDPDDRDDMTTYEVRAKTTGDGAFNQEGPSVVLATGIDDDKQLVHWAGEIGHGDAQVEVVSQRPQTIFNPAILDSDSSPFVRMHMSRFRNLIRNHSFKDDAGGGAGWTVSSGTVAFETKGVNEEASIGGPGSPDPRGEGAAGGTNSSAAWTIDQEADVAQWSPQGLSAFLRCYAFGADTNEQYRATIRALDSMGGSLGSVTTGFVNIADLVNWVGIDLKYSNLPAGTVKLRVELEGNDTLAAEARTLFDEVDVRVGDAIGDAQFLTNGSFQSGTTGWTILSGAWTTGSNSVAGTASLRPTAAGEIYQEEAVGQVGSATHKVSFLLQGWMIQNATFGVGRVIVEARQTDDTVLQFWSTGTTEPVFKDRFELAGDLPDGTNKLRVRIIADNTDIQFDEFRGFIWEALNPENEYIDVTFDAIEQQWPGLTEKTPGDVERAWEALNTPAPIGVYTFEEAEGALQIANRVQSGSTDTSLTVASGTKVGAKFAGPRIGTSYSSKGAVEVISGQPHYVEFADIADLSIDGTNSWTLLVVLRAIASTGDKALFGSLDSSGTPQGWQVVNDHTNNFLELHVRTNTGGSLTISNPLAVDQLRPRYVTVQYDADAGTIKMRNSLSASSAQAIPSGSAANLQKVRIGNSPTLDGDDAQIAYAVLWDTADVTELAITEWWKYGQEASGLVGAAIGGDIAPIAVDSDGIVVAVDGVLVYNAGLTNERGLSIGAGLSPLRTLDPHDQAAEWSVGGTITVATRNGPDATRMNRAVLVSGGPGATYRTPLITQGASDISVVWYSRSDEVSPAGSIELWDSNGVVKATQSFTPTASWQEFRHTFSWDGATASFRLVFVVVGSNDFELSWPIPVYAASNAPFLFEPDGKGGVTRNFNLFEDLSTAFNREGEVAITGICPDANPGASTLAELDDGTAGNTDRRVLRISATGGFEFDHYDGSATLRTAVTANATWDSEWTVRARWNRGGLMEDRTKGIMAEGPAGDQAYVDFLGSVSTQVIDRQTFGKNNDSPGGIISRIQITSRERPI